MTKYDANGNAVFTYGEEINGWFYDVVMNDGTNYGLCVSDDGVHFNCYADYGTEAKISEFLI